MKTQWKSYSVDVRDDLCQWRPCFRPGEWKGYIVPGQGYHYAPKSLWHWGCLHRADRGCPCPSPNPDIEKAKCCDAPLVRLTGNIMPLPRRQRCLNCGTWLTGFPLAIARNVWGQYILSRG